MTERIIIFTIVGLCAAWFVYRLVRTMKGKNPCEFCNMDTCKKTKCEKEDSDGGE